MVKTVSCNEFIQAFGDMGRKEQFSQAGLRALYDYLEQLGEDCGEPIELDVIALCCEYTEYASLEAVKSDYNGIQSMEDLEDHTTVIQFENGLIIQQY